jgi:hypothetical protein
VAALRRQSCQRRPAGDLLQKGAAPCRGAAFGLSDVTNKTKPTIVGATRPAYVRMRRLALDHSSGAATETLALAVEVPLLGFFAPLVKEVITRKGRMNS